MSVLEINASQRPGRSASDITVTVSPADLGLLSRPDFLPLTAVAARPGPTLWDTLLLSWAEPQTMRDLLGA